MKPNEIFALNHFLEAYPKNKTFVQILDMIKNEDPAKMTLDDISWLDKDQYIMFTEEYIDIEDNDYLISLIIEMANQIEKQFFPIIDLVCIIDKDSVCEVTANLLGRKPTKTEADQLCTWLDNHFSFHLPEMISEALTLLHIEK